MKRSTLSIVIILVVLIIIGLVYAMTSSSTNTQITPSQNPTSASQETTNPIDTSASSTVSTTGTSTQITLATIATHNSASSCWMAIEGKVYDVTSFIPQHPGGSAILQGCGKDATTLFDHRPTDGSSHSSRARALLQKYYIGDLAQ